MALPQEPETIESMRARFDAALEKVWDSEDIVLKDDRPGIHRTHIFDFENGVRFIISRDSDIKDGVRPFIHLSCSGPGSFDPVFIAALWIGIAGIGWKHRLFTITSGGINHMMCIPPKGSKWLT